MNLNKIFNFQYLEIEISNRDVKITNNNTVC